MNLDVVQRILLCLELNSSSIFLSHSALDSFNTCIMVTFFLLIQVYLDTVGDAEKYRVKLTERFFNIKFVVSKKADSLYPVVSGASIVAKVTWFHLNLLVKNINPSPPSFPSLLTILFMFLTISRSYCYAFQVTRDRALRDWMLDETAEDLHRKFGSGYPGGENHPSYLTILYDYCFFFLLMNKCDHLPTDPQTKAWLEDHKHSVFGFPSLVRFSWGTCTAYSKDFVDVLWSVSLLSWMTLFRHLLSESLSEKTK